MWQARTSLITVCFWLPPGKSNFFNRLKIMNPKFLIFSILITSILFITTSYNYVLFIAVTLLLLSTFYICVHLARRNTIALNDFIILILRYRIFCQVAESYGCLTASVFGDLSDPTFEFEDWDENLLDIQDDQEEATT
jgi:hypothetical protein